MASNDTLAVIRGILEGADAGKMDGVNFTNRVSAQSHAIDAGSVVPSQGEPVLKAPGSDQVRAASNGAKKASFPSVGDAKDLKVGKKPTKVMASEDDDTEVTDETEELGTESNVAADDDELNVEAKEDGEDEGTEKSDGVSPKKNSKNDFAARMAALRAKKKNGKGSVDTDNTDKENDKMKANVKSDEKAKCGTNEHVEALFSGEEGLSEDFKNKAKTIFESAISTRESELRDQIAEDCVDVLSEEVEKIRTELTEHLDRYVNYMAEQWMEENKLQVENGLKLEITESFMSGLRSLFLEHDIDVPESKADLVDELATKVNGLEEQLSREMNANIDLTEKLEDYAKLDAIAELGEGLASTQFDKFMTLCESVAYDNEDAYKGKIQIIKEAHFGNKKTNVKKPVVIVEGSIDSEGIVDDDGAGVETPTEMENISKMLNRLGKK